MKLSHFFILLSVSTVFSNDIILSKDSIQVHHDLFSSRSADGIIIVNTSADTVSLDSAYLHFDVFDTIEMSIYRSFLRSYELYWLEYGKGDFSWELSEIGPNTYKLIKRFFGPNDTPVPVYCPPGDSCIFYDLRIGLFLIGSERPVFPKTVKGVLHLFLTNNEEIRIRFYSDNDGTKVVSGAWGIRQSRVEQPRGYFSLQGRRIGDNNQKRGTALYIKGRKIVRR